jgi:parallel beta-helix repeat protein
VVSLFVGEETKSASVEQDNFSDFSDENGLDVYYFYGEGCPHCAKVGPFLAEMEQKYPLRLHKFDIYNNRDYLSLFDEYSIRHGLSLEGRGVPTVFVSDAYFVGDTPILDGFEEVVKKALQEENSSPDQALEVDGSEGLTEDSVSMTGGLSIVTVTVAALVDAISPCSIAILVFLIGARVLVADRRKRALKVGLAFCLSVFIAYFLFGLGLLTFVQVSGFSGLFSLLVGLIAILAGFFYLKDVFWYGGGGFVMEVPRSVKPLLMKMLKGVTSPFGAFVMGFVAVLFELPCTGGPYLFILGQVANSATRLQAVPLLLYYNFIFVLPLIVVSLLLYSNLFSVGKIREWNEKNKALLRLVGGFAMMALGFLVIPVSQMLQFVQLFLLCFKAVGPVVLASVFLYSFVSSRKRLMRLPGLGILLLYVIVAPVFIVPSSISLLVRPSSDVSGTASARAQGGLGDDLKAVGVVEAYSCGDAHARAQTGEGAGSLDSLIDLTLDSGKLVFLYFYLDTCGWCKKQTPVVDELEEKYFEHVSFVRVNGKDEAEAVAMFGVRGYPSMFLISGKDEMDGYVYELHRGFTEFDALEKTLTNTSHLHTTQKPEQENSETDEGDDTCDNCIAVDNPDQENYDADSLGVSNYTMAAETTCSSCAACTEIIATGHYDKVTLTQDITDHTGNCIIFYANDVVFDCANHLIDGDDTGTDYGIYLNEKTGNTIQNCRITDFREGIYLYYSTLNTITGNTLSSNHNGIYLSSSTSNTISENTVNSQVWSGIALDYSSANTISSNTIDSNNYHGIYLHNPPNNNNAINNNIVTNNQRHGLYISSESSTNNRITSNRFCSNNQLGGDYYDIYDEDANPGDENTCDTTYNWNDLGTTGCTYACSMCIDNDEDGYGVCPNCGIANGCTYDGDDCDDTEPNINPGATEVCNGVDDNCVNGIDEGGDELCDDGLWCNGAETCEGFSGCQAGTPVDCNDFNVCTADYCDEASDTCVNTPVADGTPCDDYLFCTENTVCISGVCGGGNPKSCDDFNVCTTDYCNEELRQCENTPVADGTPTGNTCGVGACERAAVCISGIETCTPGTPSPEICDGIDNDCDGQVDEGCGSDLVITDIWNENSFICYQIRNIGDEPAPEGHYTALFIDEDYRVSDVVTEELEPGERSTRCFNYEWNCTPLEDLVEVWADYENDVPENNETNNQRREIWRCDTTPPEIISGPIVQDVTQHSALIYWETNENSDSTVKYGKPARMYTSEETDPGLVTSHSISLTGLEPSTTYHFKVESADPSGNTGESSDMTFETLPLPDYIDPEVTIIDPGIISGIVIISADAFDNIGVEKVEFFLNDTLVFTDYSPPYEMPLDTNEYENGQYILKTKVYDLVGSYALHDVEIKVQNVKDLTVPNVVITSPSQWDTVSGVTLVNATISDDEGLSHGYFWVGPTPKMHYASTYFGYPLPKEAVLCVDWNTKGADNGPLRIAWEIYDKYGNVGWGYQDVIVDNPQPPTPPELIITNRDIKRNNNYFTVTLTVKNVGGQTATSITIWDYLQLFQPIHKNDNIANYQSEYDPNLVRWKLKITSNVDILNGTEQNYTYDVIPVMTPKSAGPYKGCPFPMIGAYAKCGVGWWKWEGETHLQYQQPGGIGYFHEWENKGKIVNDIFYATTKTDYLIVTNPSQLFSHNPGHKDDVNTLLSDMAELAKFRKGTLGFLDFTDRNKFRDLIEPGKTWTEANWAYRLHPDFSKTSGVGGYVLIVGETEIVPAWDIPSRSAVVKAGFTSTVHFSDLNYANVLGDWRADITVGRIIGNDASDLSVPIRTSIDVLKGQPNHDFDRSDALGVSGTGTGQSTSKKDIEDMGKILSNDGFTVRKIHWQDYPTNPQRLQQFRDNATNKDVIYFSDHCGPDEWHPALNTADFPVQFSGHSIFAFALCCLSGCYENHPQAAGGDYNIAEAFFDSGAAVYIGSTESSNWDPDTEAGKKFFNLWDADTTIGWAFTSTKQTISASAIGEDWCHYWSAEYNLYGDPKFGAEPAATSTSVTVQALEEVPPSSIDVVVPDYEVDTVEEIDFVEIPNGTTILQVDKPAVPYYTTLVHYPNGYRVQDVIMTDRSGLITDSGLNLPLTDFGNKSSKSSYIPVSSVWNDGYYPEQDYSWGILENLDGSSTLVIVMYPFYYNPLTTDVKFYKNYSFTIDYTVSPVVITELTTDKDVYEEGDTVMVDIGLNNSGEAQNVTVSAVIKTDSTKVVDGLLLRTLKEFTGLASFSPEWDSTGFDPGYYYLELTLMDSDENVLNRKTEMFRLGISSGNITDFTINPEIFDVGDDIEINMTFNNTGTVNITGVATIKIFDSNGNVVEQFLHDIIGLIPSESVGFTNTWNTINASEISYYSILGYVSYDSTTTDPVSALIQTDYDGDGVGDAEDNCRYVPNPEQNDTNSNCPLPPYTEDPKCGDACEVECPGDINGDFKVDHKDLLLLASAYGSKEGEPKYDPDADINNDGKVGHKDLLILAANYGRTCDESPGNINGDSKVDHKDLLLLAGAYACMISPLIIFASVIILATATSVVHVKHRKKEQT